MLKRTMTNGKMDTKHAAPGTQHPAPCSPRYRRVSSHSICFVLFLAALFLAGGCVSNRKITYLQFEDEVLKPRSVKTDSVVRMYETGELRYTIQPNDVLGIRIASMTPEEYNPFAIADRFITGSNVSSTVSQQGASRGYRVDPWGYLDLPVIGQLKVQGMTIDALESKIDSLAAAELEDPVTRINLLNFRFTIMGEVNSEGVQVSEDQSLTMMQAIAMAGGPADYGDLSRVKVVRKVDDRTLVFYVNVLDEEFITSEFYHVFPNDMIIVPPLRSRVYFKYITPNISVFTSVISFAASIIALFAVFGGGGAG